MVSTSTSLRRLPDPEGSIEDDRLVPVAENAPVDMPPHRTRENDTLEVAPARDQVFHLVAVRDPGHILLDNRAIVQDLGDVVTGGANQLYASGMGCVIGLGSKIGRALRTLHAQK